MEIAPARGIYTEVGEKGRRLLEEARPTRDTALAAALADAAALPELAPLVAVVQNSAGAR